MLLRIKYAKTAEGKFLSHLDMSRAWERTMRRARVPLAFSQGFHPHPKIAFGSALAVGVTSDGEYIDVEITEDTTADQFRALLESNVPPAIKVLHVQEQDKKSDALMSIINRTVYQLTIKVKEPMEQADVEKYLANFLNQEHILVMRAKKKTKVKTEKDIKPGIFRVEGDLQGETLVLDVMVQTGSEGNIRPDEVIESLIASGMPLDKGSLAIHREGLYIQTDQGLITPLEV